MHLGVPPFMETPIFAPKHTGVFSTKRVFEQQPKGVTAAVHPSGKNPDPPAGMYLGERMELRSATTRHRILGYHGIFWYVMEYEHYGILWNMIEHDGFISPVYPMDPSYCCSEGRPVISASPSVKFCCRHGT